MPRRKPTEKRAIGTISKLPPIPAGAKIQKRPLNRPRHNPSSSSNTIYISTSTPFISAVKRCRKHLNANLLTTTAAPKNASLHSRIQFLKRDPSTTSNINTNSSNLSQQLTLVATGRAIPKLLSLAAWFQEEGDCEVDVRTKTVATVDDVVVKEGEGEGEDESRIRRVSCLEVGLKLK